jgi:broad specificity phosphatase PhoE
VAGGPEEPTRQTAAIVADELKLKVRLYDEFRELNLGHWAGLTEDDFRERFPKVHRLWRTDPRSVTPPEGEAVRAAAVRLLRQLAKLLRRRTSETVVLVLGLYSAATLRCCIADPSFAGFWELVDSPPPSHSLTLTSAEATRLQKQLESDETAAP